MVLSILLRTLLDFAGVAALIPVLFAVMRQDAGRGRMLLLCGAVLLFVVLKNGAIALLVRMQSRFRLEVYSDLSRRMFVNYYRRGLPFLKAKSSVQLGYEVHYICYTFSLGVLAPLFRMVGESVLVLLLVGALLVWEPAAGLLLCAAFLPMAGLYVWKMRKRLHRYGKEELEARRKQSRTIVEAFRGYAELEVAQAFGASLASFDQGMQFIVRNRQRMEMFQLFPSFLSEAALVGGLMLLISVGQGDLGLVSGVFAVVAFRMIPAIRNILNSWGMLQNAAHTVEVVEEGVAGEAQDEPEDETPFSFGHSIELQELAFAFPDGHTLFSNLNMSIRRGERVGIRGASGSGKSTLFNLLLGFFEPTAGEIRIDGKLLTRSSRSSWHRLLGYVPQEIFIIEGTLADNVALGETQVDPEKVMKVLEQVQLKEWVDELPQGLQTQLGEYGSRLSGGQKQRIGIARALYKEAEVLLFDEATSALDSRTEQEINHTLQLLSLQHRELTLIVIAHRESSLAFCDRVIDLENIID